MTVGYSEEEDEVVERMVWWLALGIIILAPLLLHGGVIPWLFSLLPSMPGWAGAIQGPQFLTIALTSAIGGVLILSLAFRKAYDWDHIITDDVFRGLTLWLGLFTLLFLWLQLQQVVNGVFAAPIDKTHATEAKLGHPAYWTAIGLAVSVLAYTFAQAVRPSLFTKKRAVVAGVAILTATLVEKVFFVVEGLMSPTFELYRGVPGEYFPSLVELASLVGTIGVVTLIFLVVSKIFPVIELHAIEAQEHDRGDDGEPTSDYQANTEVNA